MAQLDFFSFSDQYVLVLITFWSFYVGCVNLFIIPFSGVMKMRRFISEDPCYDAIIAKKRAKVSTFDFYCAFRKANSLGFF